MNIDIQPGTYVVAVSGGVDSVVLLDLLARKPKLTITVAHFDHGIREDSSLDSVFVQDIARQLRLPFVYEEGKLGAAASEAKARVARYKFLHEARKAAGASAVITAHHQDDVIETAIINLIRGTGRKGLTSLKDQQYILRPLLGWPKDTLLRYARQRGLQWREDPTNQYTKYLRNHVRHNIVPKLNTSQRRQLLTHLNRLGELNVEIDNTLINHLHMQPAAKTLDRHWFIMLPHDQALEVMAMWLRNQNITNFDKKLLEKIVRDAKILSASKKIDVDKKHIISIGKERLALLGRN